MKAMKKRENLIQLKSNGDLVRINPSKRREHGRKGNDICNLFQRVMISKPYLPKPYEKKRKKNMTIPTYSCFERGK